MSTLTHSAACAPGDLAAPPKKRRWFRIVRSVAIAGVCGVTLLYLFRAPLLTGLARAWVIDQPCARADAIVVLGGGVEQRPAAAAQLYQQGIAPRILFMDVKLSPNEARSGALPEKELTRRILLTNEVPESALETIGSSVASTYDESNALRDWVDRHGARSIVVATDLFHTRRASWIIRRSLRDRNVEVRMHGVTPEDYGVTNWWQNEEGMVAFETEVVKLAYYHWKY